MSDIAKSRIVIFFILCWCLSGIALREEIIPGAAMAEQDQGSNGTEHPREVYGPDIRFSSHNSSWDDPVQINPLNVIAVGSCEYEISTHLYNNGNGNRTVMVFALPGDNLSVTSREFYVTVREYQMITLYSDFSGLNLSDGKYTLNLRTNSSQPMASRHIDVVNPLPGLEMTNISIPPELHFNSNEDVTVSLQNTGQFDAPNLAVEIYDGKTMLNRSNMFNISAGNHSHVSMDVELAVPANAPHDFHFLVGGHLKGGQRFVQPQTTASIGNKKKFFAVPDHDSSSKERQTKLYLTLWNDGLTPGNVNVKIHAESRWLFETNVTIEGYSEYNLTCNWTVNRTGEHYADAYVYGSDADTDQSKTSTRTHFMAYQGFPFPDISGTSITNIIIAFVSLGAIGFAVVRGAILYIIRTTPTKKWPPQ